VRFYKKELVSPLTKADMQVIISNDMPKIRLVKLKCLRCGHEWIPRQEEPRQCPKCGSAKWDIPKKPGVEKIEREETQPK